MRCFSVLVHSFKDLEDGVGMKIEKVDSKVSFPELEATVLARWKREKTFEASLEKTKGGAEFIFYDGPPFPTGSPHHGTIFVSILKDVIPRYKTMRGIHVPRRWGWDSHGLPIETQAEKSLGITDKKEIEQNIGVAAFNAECRRIVSNFNEAWKTYIDRIGRWVDMENPYSTLDRSFMESVIWSFAESYKKGLIYRDYRVSPYCYRCQTPLSISDTRSDDSTRSRQDRTVTVRIPITGRENTYLMVWTTTPWTLPSNLAVAVGPKIDYVFVEHGGATYILAEALLEKHRSIFHDDAKVVRTITGEVLVAEGMHYSPLFPYFENGDSSRFQLITADFVTTDDGTGLVHIAPGFGEDDYWTSRDYGIDVVVPVDEKGEFTEEVRDFVGQNVHAANGDVIKHLKSKGAVLLDQTIEHNYPHCWRCRTPLIYRALDAWYFRVEKIKTALVEKNQDISWYPESVKFGRFQNWLENARDWNISRNRYWATPIPVWICADCGHEKVVGSGAEIEALAGHEVPDLHKEFLDEITCSCEKCSGTMRRTSEVLDGWWESGSMPYGQMHYPFEDKERFDKNFPADFIVEYTGQIRCWFYYLHVLSTALFESPAFKNCLVHGTLLAEDGKKISKSQKNYTDPLELLDQYGADALRGYLLSSAAVQMADLAFSDDGVALVVKSVLLPAWNALSFFTSYASIDDIRVEDLSFDLHRTHLSDTDSYILGETELLIQTAEKHLDEYSIHLACRLLPEFLDKLNNWYIRRSRSRVWSSDKRAPDKLAFYATLHRVLSRFTQVLAPFCPFTAEALWERLGHAESVHLSTWPSVDAALINQSMSIDIGFVRQIISSGLGLRMKERIRVRQPLSRARIASSSRVALENYSDIIKDELNVKAVDILDDPSALAQLIGKPNTKILGPRIGGAVQQVVRAAKEGNFSIQDDGSVIIGDFTLAPEEISLEYVGKDGEVVGSGAGFVISLDMALSEELMVEGFARDLIRHIQELRKETQLELSDRIQLQIDGADAAVSRFADTIKSETLCLEILDTLANPEGKTEVQIDDVKVMIALRRTASN